MSEMAPRPVIEVLISCIERALNMAEARIKELERENAALTRRSDEPVPLSEWQKMEAENAAMKAEIATLRDSAIEECAVVCDDLRPYFSLPAHYALEHAALVIRKRKAKQ